MPSCSKLDSCSVVVKLLLVVFPFLVLLALDQSASNTATTTHGTNIFQVKSAFDAASYHSYQEPFASYPCQPHKVHLSQANNVDREAGVVAMTISFTIDFKQCTNVRPTIVYGRGFFPEGTVSTTEKVQFNYASTPTGEKNYTSDWIHHAKLEHLVAGGERYWYRIVIHQKEVLEQFPASSNVPLLVLSGNLHASLRGTQSLVGQTPVYSFVTPPLSHQPTSLALVGDLGQTENSTKTMHHILKAIQESAGDVPPVSALLIAGDLSYSDGDPHRWESWLELMEPLLRTTPLYAAGGNHEIECDNITHNIFVPYEHYFRNPNRIQDPDMLPVPDEYRKTLWHGECTTSSEFLGHYNYGNSFYAFTHGLTHTIVLNSYTDTMPDSVQYQWLDKELQSVDRTITPWLIVMYHCPLHTTFIGHNGEINGRIMLESMEPLFVQYQVNLIVSGHDHAFMRTHPMVGSQRDPSKKGPVYLTLGAGGNREQHSKGYIHDIPEDWVAKRDDTEYGYGHLFVANRTHAHFNWVRDGTTQDGTRDSVWLENQLFLEN